MKRHIVIAQGLLIAIVLSGVVYVGDSVMQSRLFGGTYTVRVDLASAGGLHDRSTVTYRGNRIGVVKHVRLTPTGIEAELSINSGMQVPVDTKAVVADLSPIGEQYLDFRPRSAGPPYLTSGSVIAAADTSTPLRFDKLLSDAGSVASTIDPKSIETITRELSTAFGPDSVDLGLLGRQTGATLRLLEQIQPALLRILRNSHVVLGTVADNSDSLISFSRDLDTMTARLKKSDPTIRSLLTSANGTVPLVDGLVQDSSPNLHLVFRDSLTLAELASSRQQGLAHWLTWAPYQMIDMAESTREGAGHTLLVPNPSPTCDYGSKQTYPTDTTRREARTDAACTMSDPIVQQRGSQYVPRPR